MVSAVLVTVLSVLAVAMNIAFVWPQAVHLARTREVDGLSPGGWVISAVFFSVWTEFAIRTQFWSLLLANASSLAATLVILLLGTRAGWPRMWAALAMCGVLAALGAGIFARPLIAVLMIGGGVALRAPHLASLLRRSSVVGVSPATWWLSVGTTGCWLVVSLSRGATVVVISSAAALAATVVLLMALYWRIVSTRSGARLNIG